MATIYLPVYARLNLSSAQRAAGISQELYNLTYPKQLHEPGRTTTTLLPTITHPTTAQVALVADSELTIEVHPARDLHALVALFPQLTQEERDSFVYYIATSSEVSFALLMPSDAEQLTEAEASAAGWFGEGV